MEFFDAHTHVQFSAYGDDRGAVIRRAREAGVLGMVNVGSQKDTSRAAVELAEQYDGLYASIGLHPTHTSRSFHDADELGGGAAAKAFASRGEVFDPEAYRSLALHPKTVAIGECGLDYFHFNEDEAKEDQIQRQKDAFIAQIAFARGVGKPLMIHCRDAFPDLIAILKEEMKPGDRPGIIHFFGGTKEEAATLLAMGFYFTFGGVVTFPPKKGMTAGPYDDVVRLIPADRILSETDAPYVAPARYRGERNEPAYVVEVVKKLAELKGAPLEEMAARIVQNTRAVFGIKFDAM